MTDNAELSIAKEIKNADIKCEKGHTFKDKKKPDGCKMKCYECKQSFPKEDEVYYQCPPCEINICLKCALFKKNSTVDELFRGVKEYHFALRRC